MSLSRSLARRRRLFFLTMAALVLGAFGLTALFVLHAWEEETNRSFDTASLHARAFETHLTQSFNVINSTLANMAEIDQTEIAAAGAPKGFIDALRQAPSLRFMALLDADGNIVASSNGRSLGRQVALGGFLPPQPGLASVLRVGAPWRGRDFDDGQPSTPEQPVSAGVPGFLPVSRDVVLGDGRRVTLLATVNGDYFVHHYTQVLASASVTVDWLWHDGTLLLSTAAARLPGVGQGADRAATRLAQNESGRFEQRLEDGRAVLTAYRASSAYPFVIRVHFDKAQALAHWREEVAGLLTVVIVVLLAGVALATWFYFRLERSARLRDAAEVALQASEAQYRNTFDHAAVGIAHASPEGRFLRCNQHLCDMLGYSAEELAHKTISEVTHPDDLANDLLLRQRLLTGEIPSYRLQKRYVRRNGESVWVQVAAGVVRDPAGAVDYRIAVIEDIHLRKLTRLALEALNSDLAGEAFLRQTTQTLATLLGVEFAFVSEAAPMSTRRFNTRAVCVDGQFVPDFSYDLEGTPCEKVVGSNALHIYAQQVQQQFPGDELLATMGIESYAAVPLGRISETGTPAGVFAIMSRHPLRHIEEVQTLLPLLAVRVGAELVREREARMLHDLFDRSPSAVFLIDRQFTILINSRAAERLFGWEPQALIGQKLALLFPAEHREAYEALLQRFAESAVAGPIDSGAKDIWVRRRDASTFPAQVQLRTLDTAKGRMTVAYVQDITERKRAQAALLQHAEELESKVAARTVALLRARDEAEQANRAKSAFLAAMSHEIRTPMNGVVGMIDVLEQGPLESEQAEIVKTVRESANALLSIVDDVLDFSKIEAGHFLLDNEPMDVTAVVEGVCDMLDPLAGKKGVELTLFTDPAIPGRVLGDATRLRQVLLNLAGNAIKFSSAPGRAGRVAVRARLVGRGLQQVGLEFSVADNGIGMDQETLSRLFTPFTQADASTTRRFGGTGLGLSISHGLVELMGGEIGVRSEPGHGSTFSVRLSLATLPAGSEIDAEAFDLGGLACLVLGGPPADDLAVYLAHSGAAVHRVADEAAARQWLGNCRPGLCIGVVCATDAAAGDRTLAEWRAVCSARPNLQGRFVVVERGRRRGLRVKADDHVSLDRDVLRRSVFMKAVAWVAGRIAANAVKERAPFKADTPLAPLPMQPAGAQGRLILVAEDNEINQKVLRKQLALLGFMVHIAGNGREALECWQRGDYALLLTDLHMPEMDGYDLAVAIREAEAGQRRMPIVVLTANALKGEAKRCLEFGIDDYMSKPVQLANLKALLYKWLPTAATRAPELPAPATAVPALALDVSVLQALVGDEPAVIKEFLQDFRLSAGQAVLQMRAACQSRQAPAVEALAHKLKSAARSVGALALGELCAQMEAAGQASQLDTLAKLWPRFEAEIAAVDECLGSLPA